MATASPLYVFPRRRVMKIGAALLAAAAAASPAVAEDYTPAETWPLDLVDDLELHATEAGILDFVGVKEGARVRAEDVLVKIDTRQAEKARDVARLALRAAVELARDEIEITYAKAAADVAMSTLQELRETNARVQGAVTEADVRQARLDHRRSILAIEKAEKDKMMAGFDAQTKMAELQAAELAIERRTLRAPFAGMVQRIVRDEKEWVNPGDPILRLIRLDTLQVDVLVPIADHAPADLDGCEVTVSVAAGGGRTVTATGRVVYIDPILVRGVQGQQAVVRAEITNREQNGRWAVLPKMKAQMTIHLGTGAAAA
ncbi:MAG: HlyD family efflux transporter periplasmic adaptor subunit, partial [Planctomycetota bacterium]